MKRLSLFILAVLSSTMMFGQTLHYQADYSGCNNLYTKITGVFAVNGEQIYNGAGMEGQGGQNIEIGVFDQNEVCRFTRVPQWRAKSSQYIYQMSIRGTEGMVYHFKVYDHNTNMETDLVDDFGQVIEYVPNAQIGSTSNPFILNFTHTSSGYTKDIVGYGDSDGGYYLIASPVVEEVTPGAENGFLTTAYDLYFFDGSYPAEEWRNYKVDAFTLTNGKGYLYASQTNTTLTFTGTPYEGDTLEVTLAANEANSPFGNWNLVGNPFAEDGATFGDRPYYKMNETGTGFIAYNGNFCLSGKFICSKYFITT